MGNEPSGKAIIEFKEIIKENAKLREKISGLLQISDVKGYTEAIEKFIAETHPSRLKIIINGGSNYNNQDSQFFMEYDAEDKRVKIAAAKTIEE